MTRPRGRIYTTSRDMTQNGAVAWVTTLYLPAVLGGKRGRRSLLASPWLPRVSPHDSAEARWQRSGDVDMDAVRPPTHLISDGVSPAAFGRQFSGLPTFGASDAKARIKLDPTAPNYESSAAPRSSQGLRVASPAPDELPSSAPGSRPHERQAGRIRRPSVAGRDRHCLTSAEQATGYEIAKPW